MRRVIDVKVLISFFVFFALVLCKAAVDDTSVPGESHTQYLARKIFKSSSAAGGLCVHLGCGNGKLTVALFKAGGGKESCFSLCFESLSTSESTPAEKIKQLYQTLTKYAEWPLPVYIEPAGGPDASCGIPNLTGFG